MLAPSVGIIDGSVRIFLDTIVFNDARYYNEETASVVITTQPGTIVTGNMSISAQPMYNRYQTPSFRTAQIFWPALKAVSGRLQASNDLDASVACTQLMAVRLCEPA